jgi:hypothetical protein
MKPKNGHIVIIQLVLVLMMSAAAAYCLFPITGLWTILVFVGLLLTGVSMIIFPRVGALPFSLLTFTASLPAILSHNILDIGKLTYKGSGFFGQTTLNTTTLIPYWMTLSIGLFLISGYLVLSYLNSLQREYQAAISGNADIPETKKVTSRNTTIAIIYPALAGLSAAALIIPLNVLQPAISEYMQNYSWSIIVFGLISVLLVGGLIYWLGIFKHKSISEDLNQG